MWMWKQLKIDFIPIKYPIIWSNLAARWIQECVSISILWKHQFNIRCEEKKSPWSYFLGFVSWSALKEDSTCGDYWTGKTPRCGEIVLLILYNFYYLTFYFTRWAWTPRTAPAICQQRRKLRLKSHLMTSRLRLSFCVFIAQEDIVHGLKYTFSFAFLKGSTLVIIIWMELHTGGISGCAFSSCFKPL